MNDRCYDCGEPLTKCDYCHEHYCERCEGPEHDKLDRERYRDEREERHAALDEEMEWEH